MKRLILIIFIFNAFLSFSRDTVYVNKLKIEFNQVPPNYYTTDTITKKISIIKSYTFNGLSKEYQIKEVLTNIPYTISSPQSNFIYGSTRYISDFYIKCKAIVTIGDSANLYIKINDIKKQNLQLNNNYIIESDSLFVERPQFNLLKIEYGLEDTLSNVKVELEVEFYNYRTEILVETNLPSEDTVFIDKNNKIYSSLTPNCVAIDTSTIVDTAFTYYLNPPPGLFHGYTLDSTYNDYYVAIYLYNHGTARFDTNDVLVTYTHSYFSISYMDTLHLQKNTKLFFSGFTSPSNKNDFFRGILYIFHTTTKISFDSTTNINTLNIKNSKLTIYPNPAYNVLYLESTKLQPNFEYLIYDIKGSIIKQETTNNKAIPVQSLQNGIYYIVIPEYGLKEKFIKK